MNGVLWRRWALGVAVAGVVPVAAGGAGCGGKSDENPEPSAGSPSTSGSATAGTAAGGLGASGGAGGNSAAGQSAGGAGGASTGGASTGGASGTCCTPGVDPTCSADGHELKWCGTVPGASCNGVSSFYVNVWQVQACPSGCNPVGSGGGPMTAHCN